MNQKNEQKKNDKMIITDISIGIYKKLDIIEIIEKIEKIITDNIGNITDIIGNINESYNNHNFLNIDFKIRSENNMNMIKSLYIIYNELSNISTEKIYIHSNFENMITDNE